jgi:hypothetical protein
VLLAEAPGPTALLLEPIPANKNFKRNVWARFTNIAAYLDSIGPGATKFGADDAAEYNRRLSILPLRVALIIAQLGAYGHLPTGKAFITACTSSTDLEKYITCHHVRRELRKAWPFFFVGALIAGRLIAAGFRTFKGVSDKCIALLLAFAAINGRPRVFGALVRALEKHTHKVGYYVDGITYTKHNLVATFASTGLIHSPYEHTEHHKLIAEMIDVATGKQPPSIANAHVIAREEYILERTTACSEANQSPPDLYVC